MKLIVISVFIFTCLPFSQQSKHEFDLLIFTQNWPATVCKEWKKLNPQHKCIMPHENDAWTIHGIWPTKLGTIGPSFCNRTWLFDPEQIRPIEDQLIEKWINVFNGTSLYALWSHEWTKHGTCAAQLESFDSELKYFGTGLDWLQKYSMGSILNDAGISPSNTKDYHITEINDAIKKRLDIDPAIECRKIDGVSYITEIRICFTKDLKLCNCDGVLGRTNVSGNSIITNCDGSKNIVYPHYKENSLYIQLYKLVTWLQWFTL